MLEVSFNSWKFILVIWLRCSTWMNSNRSVEILRKLTQIVSFDCIFNVARRNQQMLASNTCCPLHDLLIVSRVHLFASIMAHELVAGEVGSNIVERIFGDLFVFHRQGMQPIPINVYQSQSHKKKDKFVEAIFNVKFNYESCVYCSVGFDG